MKKESCWNCSLAIKHTGSKATYYEPGTFPYVRCSCPDLKKDFFDSMDLACEIAEPHTTDTFEVYASACGHYNPDMFETCVICLKEINKPKVSWNFAIYTDWNYDYNYNYINAVPVCGAICKSEFINRYKPIQKE